MSKRLLVALWVGLLCVPVVPGCSESPFALGPTTRPAGPAASPAASPSAPPASGQAPALPPGKVNEDYILLVMVGVAEIEAPVGTISASEQVWSYLNEESIAVGKSASLGRNGIRIGTGSRSNWADFEKVIKRLTGRGLETAMKFSQPAAPIPVEVKREQGVQTIFTIYEDRTMGGQDYPAGDNLMTLSCTFNVDDLTAVLVTGLPQIRTTHRSPKIVREMNRMMVVEKPTYFSFSDLTFQLRVPNSDFLVIGPGTQSRRPNSVGRHFLVKEKDGVEFETILILTPQIVAAPVKKAVDDLTGAVSRTP